MRTVLLIAGALALLVLYLTGAAYYALKQGNLDVPLLQPPTNPIDFGNPPKDPYLQPPFRTDYGWPPARADGAGPPSANPAVERPPGCPACPAGTMDAP